MVANSNAADIPTLHTTSLKEFEIRAASVNPDKWSFIFLGDNRSNDLKFKKILRRAQELNPVFILHGGDIVEKGTSEELSRFLSVIKSVAGLPPLFVVRGNHEMNAALFEKMIGPLNFVLDNQRLGFRVVAVDNSQYVLNNREIKYLKNNLDNKRQNQFVAMHIPPKTERWPKHSFETGKNQLLSIMTDRNVKMGLFAHIHLFDADVINSIPCIISGGAGSQLAWFGYSGDAEYHMVVVEVEKGTVSYRVERFETELIAPRPNL